MSAIQSDYRTFKHIPSRKCYQLIMEIPEEEFANVCQVLGYPRTGENTYVGIALLGNSIVTKPEINCDKSEGEKLRTRAIMLCKDENFQLFVSHAISTKELTIDASLMNSIAYLKHWCGIQSRSELTTNINAQNKFKELLEQYKSWQYENLYAENLNRG